MMSLYRIKRWKRAPSSIVHKSLQPRPRPVISDTCQAGPSIQSLNTAAITDAGFPSFGTFVTDSRELLHTKKVSPVRERSLSLITNCMKAAIRRGWVGVGVGGR